MGNTYNNAWSAGHAAGHSQGVYESADRISELEGALHSARLALGDAVNRLVSANAEVVRLKANRPTPLINYPVRRLGKIKPKPEPYFKVGDIVTHRRTNLNFEIIELSARLPTARLRDVGGAIDFGWYDLDILRKV